MSGLFAALANSMIQFLAVFGCFLAGAAVLTLLSRWTNNVIRQSRFPEAGTYLFGWIGVPVHEFSHAFFCRIFLHKVTAIKWFDAKAKGGAHGSVTHTYHQWNVYHRIGHFFIGLGPALLCPFVIALLYWLLVPGAGPELKLLFSKVTLIEQKEIFRPFLTGAAFHSAGTWIFLYLTSAICTQVELSKEDLKQVLAGIVPLLLVLFVLNTGAWAFDWKIHSFILTSSSKFQSAAITVFGFASILAATTFFVCAIVCGSINVVLGRPFGNPFRSS
jgi:hypothetical protein